MGFDVDVIEEFAAESNHAIEWVTFDWPDLQEAVATSEFDVAVGGITWRPYRAIVGSMTRALAIGGPCLVGDSMPRAVAVNEGGILERWTRARFQGGAQDSSQEPATTIVAVDDNESLPRLLSTREVDAFVTDSFEVLHFAGDVAYECEPATDRKTYWVSPAGGAELARSLDDWIAEREDRIDALRVRHFGRSQPRDELDHFLDLVGRRLELMPLVAAWKQRHGAPIEDLERERVVLDAVERDAATLELDPVPARRLFSLLIDLAKRVQRRSGESTTGSPAAAIELDQLRPLLLALGTRILEAYRDLPHLGAADFEPEVTEHLELLLDSSEIDELLDLLVETTSNRPGSPAAQLSPVPSIDRRPRVPQ